MMIHPISELQNSVRGTEKGKPVSSWEGLFRPQSMFIFFSVCPSGLGHIDSKILDCFQNNKDSLYLFMLNGEKFLVHTRLVKD